MRRISPTGTALVDNQDTWLAHSDLVFVDPIGTGYSRPTKPEYGAEFYQTRGDAESAVAEFIRLRGTAGSEFPAKARRTRQSPARAALAVRLEDLA